MLNIGQKEGYLNQMSHYMQMSVILLIFLVSLDTFTKLGINSLVWYLVYALFFVIAGYNYSQVLKYTKENWFLFLVPFWAFVSSIWSLSPEWSLRSSTQLIITTFIAIWIGSELKPSKVFEILLVATSIGVLASFINYFINVLPSYEQADYYGADKYYVGIYMQKNVLGKAINLMTIALMIYGVNKKRIILSYIIAFSLFIPLYMSNSVSSILVYFLTLLLPLIYSIYKTSKHLILLFLTIAAVLSATLFMLVALDIYFIDNILSGIGKDSTLTGRTFIWGVGWQAFLENPILGLGYQSFWHSPDSIGANDIRAVYGDSINGFHSAYLETLVATGIIGFSAFFFFLVITLRKYVQSFMSTHTISTFGSVFFIITTLIFAFFDVIVYRQHEIYFLLLVTLYVSSSRIIKADNVSEKNINNLNHLSVQGVN